MPEVLAQRELEAMHAYWRAANYLSVGQSMGIGLDPQKNAVQADVISTPGSACTVRVIPTNEDLMIARHTRTLLVSTAAL